MRSKRAVVLALNLGTILCAWVVYGPVDRQMLDAGRFASVTVVDRNNVPIYQPLSIAGGRGTSITADELPPLVVAATLAAEDRRFFEHPGVDPLAIVRAAWRNVASRGIAQGGSTITQQVAKLLRNSRGRSWRNKLAES